jgi:spermidine synthase
VLDVDTPYHHISVIDDAITGSRQLRFDRYVESAIYIDPPHHSLSAYTRYFHLAFLAQPEIRRAMFIGAGGGVGPRAFHMHDADMEIDVVDIDEEVLRVAREYFYMPAAATIRPVAADGRSFVRDAEDGHYDAIILDAFTIGGRIPFHLVTREFFSLCRAKLAPGGVLVMNINSSLRGPSSAIYQSMFKTIDEAFPHVHAFAVGSRGMLVKDSTNVMLVAVNADEELTREDWAARAAAYESSSYVDRRQVETMVGDLVTTPPEVKGAALFTDDFAPIETMAFD